MASSAKALTPATMCIWDPTGNQGPIYSFFYDVRVKALNWGVKLDTPVLETETEALDKLEKGECDIAVVTAIMARDFVLFGGSLDAIGAVRNQQQMRTLIATLTSPKLRPALQNGKFEISGILPVGPMYAFVRDRKMTALREFRDKNIAALNSDVQTRRLARMVGARPINTSVTNFADKFKNGTVDIVFMPAIAYTAFELEKAMQDQGGIIDIRFFNGMLQIIANLEGVDPGLPEKMRQYMASKMEDIFHIINTAEQNIPEHYWIKTDPKTRTNLEEFFKDIRLQLMVENKLDRRALHLLWRIRCKVNSNHSECLT